MPAFKIKIMQYILSEKELKDLVPKNDLLTEQVKVDMLVKAFRDSCACRKNRNMGYCDNCPIGSLNNGLSPHTKICEKQEYSK